MQKRIIVSLVGVFAIVLCNAAYGFDISRSRTKAEVMDTGVPPDPVIQFSFAARLVNNGAFSPADVVATWQEVGGIEPIPFNIIIPAECVVALRGVLFVPDFEACGVVMTFGSITAPPLSIISFAASIVRLRDGSSRMDIRTSFTDTNQALDILGALGGAAVQVEIGTEVGMSLPRGVETVSGIEPTPF